MKNQIFEISVEQSNIDWKGRKMSGEHFGTIGLKKGSLLVIDGKLVAGKFVVDTTSIKVTDVKDPATNAQFVGHLASNDFFATEQFPEAVFEITSVNKNHVVGDLTIKGITHPAAFDTKVFIKGNTLRASGKIVIDRTRFGMKFKSGNFFNDLGQTLIHNDFDLDFNITAKAA